MLGMGLRIPLFTSSATSQVELTGRHPMTSAPFLPDILALNLCSTAHESPRSSSDQSRPQPGSHRSYLVSATSILLLSLQPAVESMHVFTAPVQPISLALRMASAMQRQASPGCCTDCIVVLPALLSHVRLGMYRVVRSEWVPAKDDPHGDTPPAASHPDGCKVFMSLRK
ncbi:hypothetical protein BDW22DRAFT_976047 [Trametopsis cervina]|nr:hypothetical protein BDW22DRAFT_976047 [Trametopsis cervina]